MAGIRGIVCRQHTRAHLLGIIITSSLLHRHIGEMNIWHKAEIRIKDTQMLNKLNAEFLLYTILLCLSTN